MESTAQALVDTITAVTPLLLQIPDATAAQQTVPGKWSKKQILGHLIDSASNNHQKFVRTMLANDVIDFVGYEQDAWVDVQRYQEQKWEDLIALWTSYNHHLAHLMRSVAPSKRNNSIRISGNGPYNLAFLMADYHEHLKHHLMQIIPNAGLTSAFSMTAYV